MLLAVFAFSYDFAAAVEIILDFKRFAGSTEVLASLNNDSIIISNLSVQILNASGSGCIVAGGRGLILQVKVDGEGGDNKDQK
jgi:hypothetical protein